MKIAKTEDQKALRIQSILDAADSLFSEREIQQIRMEDIAQRCNLSKGTLFNYFKSKESLFLALLNRHFHHYLDDFIAFIAASETLSRSEFSSAVARSIEQLFDPQQQHNYLRLLAMKCTILCQAKDAELFDSFENQYAERNRELSEIVSQRVDYLSPQRADMMFKTIHAIIIGFYGCCQLNANEESELSYLKDQAITAVHIYLQGLSSWEDEPQKMNR